MSYMERLVLMHVADTPGERHAVSRIVEDAIDERTAALLARAARAEADAATLREALMGLCINANRLCDRNLGGTYEEDCRRSLTMARAALTSGDQG